MNGIFVNLNDFFFLFDRLLDKMLVKWCYVLFY